MLVNEGKMNEREEKNTKTSVIRVKGQECPVGQLTHSYRQLSPSNEDGYIRV